MILLIGATDNTGGAGLSQDQRTAEALGCSVGFAVTGVTVQGKKGVSRIHPVPLNILKEQIATQIKESHPSIIKIGVLCSLEQIKMIHSYLRIFNTNKNETNYIIADPVFAPTKGKKFLDQESISGYLELLNEVDVLTPNLKELEQISEMKITDKEHALEAAMYLVKKYDMNVAVTGGHFKGKNIEEWLVTPNESLLFKKKRIQLGKYHGTGCCLSTAIAAYLQKGYHLTKAYAKATEFVSIFLK